MTDDVANPELGRTIDTAGIATNVHDIGSGTPVVLLHGSGPGVSAWANWRANLAFLAQRFRVIAPDIVGFGFTERPPDITYDMPTWTRHLEAVLDALELERVSIVGNSFGGALALRFAIANPDRVTKLVLMGSGGVPFDLTEGLDRVWGYQPSVENMRALLDIFAFDRGLVSDELAELRYQASIRPGVQEAYEQMFPAPRQRWIDVLASDFERIPDLTMPTLVVHGAQDDVIPLSAGQQLFSLLQRGEMHVFGACGHWTQIEHAARFNTLVADFIGAET